jgi:hypothetical protein
MSFRLQYSIERIWAAIGGVSTNPSALYSTVAAKYRAPYPVYSMSSLVQVKTNIITTPAILPAIFH